MASGVVNNKKVKTATETFITDGNRRIHFPSNRLILNASITDPGDGHNLTLIIVPLPEGDVARRYIDNDSNSVNESAIYLTGNNSYQVYYEYLDK